MSLKEKRIITYEANDCFDTEKYQPQVDKSEKIAL